MDVSTLFAAPNTAASTAALSFGALSGNGGNGAVPGDGLGGLDNFNQLLGNFLSLTGGEMQAATLSDTGLAAEGDGTALTVPPGMAAMPGSALLKGMGTLTGLAGNGATGRGVEGRWSQSGLNLLAGGGLTGQELNPEVLDFLNDLSSVIAANGVMANLTGGTAPVAEATDEAASGSEFETDATETLIVLQGDITTLTAAPDMSIQAPGPVIPLTMTAAPPAANASSGLMTMTTAGTGLQSLPTVPAPEDRVIPASTPVIPRLMTTAATAATAAPAAVTAQAIPASTPTPVINPSTPAAAVPATEPSVTVSAVADTTPVQQAAAAPALAMPAPLSTPIAQAPKQTAAAPAAGGIAPPVADERTAAIALPADLANTATAGLTSDDVPVTLPAAADVATLPRIKVTGPVSASPSTPSMLTEQPAEPRSAPALKSATAAPAVTAPAAEQTPDMKASSSPAEQVVGTTSTVKTADVKTAQAPTLTAPVAENAAPKPPPGPTLIVKSTTEPVMSAKPQQPSPIATIAETPPMETVEATDTGEPAAADIPATQTGAITARPTVNVTKPAAPPATAQARAAAAPSLTPTPDETVEAVDVETEEVTNQRMLAPKHLGSDARAEAQADMAGPAQTAGQNTANARPDAPAPTVNGEREDNLLSRAVTAAGKAHEGGNSTDGEATGSSDMGAPGDLPDGMTGTASGIDTVKTQSTDFAQSLKQTAAPHRTNAYMPPTHQMAMQVQRAVQEGNERLSIRLNPQELGRIDVQLEIGTEGKLRAKVMVENPQTLEMLQKDAKTLEKALQDAGLQTDQNSLSFSLQDSGDQAQQRQDQRDEAGYGTALASTEDEQEDPAILAQTQILELGRVDVRV